LSIREKLKVQSPAEAVEFLNFMVYGEPGSGKTYLAATAQDSEDTKPILFLDVEGGVTTLRKRKDVDVVAVRSMDDVTRVHNDLFRDTSHYYKTVILDSLSELQKLDMRTVMQAEKDKSPTPERVDVDAPTQRAWGISGEHVRRVVRAYRDLPCHTIMTALVGTEFDTDEKGKEDKGHVKLYYPLFPGKLRGEIPGFFDVVGFLQADADRQGNQTRTLQVAKTKRVVAKDRTASLGLIVKEPSIPMMWSMIHGEQVTNNT